LDTTSIIEWGGFVIIALLVFAETGLLLGLVIPGGESLIFTAGLLASSSTIEMPVYLMLIILICMGMAGDIAGYYIGQRFGQRLYEKKDRWYFRKSYLDMAEDFLKRHRGKAFVLGKFLPVVRPFTPVMAGVTQVAPRVFISVSAVACILYMSSFLLAGYFLGSRFPRIGNYIHWILPVSIVLAMLVVVYQYRKYKKRLAK
jgi:membrane-associated protein